jgi:hypothetical protein
MKLGYGDKDRPKIEIGEEMLLITSKARTIGITLKEKNKI